MQKQIVWFQNAAKKFNDNVVLKKNDEGNDKISTRENDQIVGGFFFFLNESENKYEKCNVLDYDKGKQQYKVRNTSGEIFFLKRNFPYSQEDVEEFLKNNN